MKTRMILLLALIIALGGCRFVLDDNPPENEDEVQKSSLNKDQNDPSASTVEQHSDTLYLNSQDPYVFKGLTENAIPVSIAAARAYDGTVRSIDWVRFGTPGSERILRVTPDSITYEPDSESRVTIKPSPEGAIARVVKVNSGVLQSFWVSTDMSMVQSAGASDVQGQENALSHNMAAYAQSTGYFVAKPEACGSPINTDTGTILSLQLTQGSQMREYPIRLNSDSVWRSSVFMPDHEPAIIADKSALSETMLRGVKEACMARFTAEPDTTNTRASLTAVARNLSGLSTELSSIFPKLRNDIEGFCSLDLWKFKQSSTVSESPFESQKPIDVRMRMQQGLAGVVVSREWQKQPGESVEPQIIESTDQPMVLDINYSDTPLYEGDTFQVRVLSQCTNNHALSLRAYSDNNALINAWETFLHPTDHHPVVSNNDNLFQVVSEGRHTVVLELRDQGDVMQRWVIKPTLR